VRAHGELACRRGDPAAAVAEIRGALAGSHDDRSRARLYDLLGIALGMLGDLEGASDAFEHELRAATAAGMEMFVAATHGNIAETQLRLGNETAAAHHQVKSRELARAHGASVMVALSVMLAARLTAARGRHRDAVVLQAAADRALEHSSFALFEEDARARGELMDAGRQNLGGDEFHRAVAEGHELDHDTAAELAAAVLTQVRNQQEAMR
jgi:hypothetical protein